MTHEAVRDKLLDLAYGELSRREARPVEEHAAACDACRAELERIRETRKLVSALPPVEAPERGENVLLAAARERARLREPRWRVPRWLLGASVAAASLVVVAAVSYRIIAMRPGPLGKSEHDALLGEARPGQEAARAQPQAPAVAASPAKPDEPKGRAAAAPTPPAPRLAPEERVKAHERGAAEGATERELAEPFRDDRGEAPRSPPSRAGGGMGTGAGIPRGDTGPRPLPRTGGGEGQGQGIRQPFAEPPPAAAASAPPAAVRSETFAKRLAPEAPAAKATAREEAADAAVAEVPRAQAPPERDASRVRAAPAAPVAKGAPSRAAAKAPSPALDSEQFGYAGRLADRGEAQADDPVARWQALRASGKLTAEVRTFSGCPPDGPYDPHHFRESFRKLERDLQGRLVRYEMRGTIEGGPFEAEGFYDAAGVLRVERWTDGGKVSERRHPAAGPSRTRFPARASGATIDAPGVCDN